MNFGWADQHNSAYSSSCRGTMGPQKVCHHRPTGIVAAFRLRPAVIGAVDLANASVQLAPCEGAPFGSECMFGTCGIFYAYNL